MSVSGAKGGAGQVEYDPGINEAEGNLEAAATSSSSLADMVADLADACAGGMKDVANFIRGGGASEPGGVKAPDAKGAEGTPGYGKGEAKDAEDTGKIGEGGDAAGGDFAEMDKIMNNPNLSLESKIFMVLLALQTAKRKEVAGEFEKTYKDKKASAGMEKGKAKDEADADSQKALATLQKDQQELNELSSMTTNISKLFHDMKSATIQNIR